MIDFWIAALLLLAAALAFLLIPIWRGLRAQSEEDRTALNVALYQEHLAELSAQHMAGTLSEAQWEAARTEAARELLADTEGSQKPVRGLGRAIPLLVALLVPVLGCVLYLQWGSQDKLALTRELATAPSSPEEMISRLQRVVAMQPEAGQIWYVLGRAYMTQNQPANAAPAFERAISLLGRQPELLGQLIQARYFSGATAAGRRWSPALQQLAEEALQGNPQEPTTLGLLGVAAFEEKRFQEAIGFWERLMALLPAEDPSRAAIQGGITRARADLAQQQASVAPAPVVAEISLQIAVSLSAEASAQAKPDDTVFVFAHAPNHLPMPMPLAVKRLRVADLPALVTLSDADAMLPQLRLSAFEQVRLGARVSRSGNPRQGEWKAETPALNVQGHTAAIPLVIDQAEAP